MSGDNGDRMPEKEEAGGGPPLTDAEKIERLRFIVKELALLNRDWLRAMSAYYKSHEPDPELLAALEPVVTKLDEVMPKLAERAKGL